MWRLMDSGFEQMRFETEEEARAELKKKQEWESNFRYTHCYWYIEEVKDAE